ncbi:MAG: PAS domain S-box protein [Thermoanaerobaculia bacterium]
MLSILLVDFFSRGATLAVSREITIAPWWIVTAVAAVISLLFFFHGWRAAARSLVEGRGTTMKLLRVLLIASVTVPFATDEFLRALGSGGIFDSATIESLEKIVVATLLGLIILYAAKSVQRSERLRLAALEELRTSREHLQLQIDSMPFAYITCSPAMLITRWNPAAEKIFGWTAEEIVGRGADVLTPEYSDLMSAGFEEETAGGGGRQSVTPKRSKSGRIILCRWEETALVDDQGNLVELIAMASDVTAEQRAQREFQDAERRHRELLDTLPHCIFSVDLHDRYTAVNAATCEFFGLPEAEIIGRSPLEIGLPAELSREWLEQKASCRQAGRTLVFDRRVTVRGEARMHETILSPMRAGDGSIIGVTGISIDVTELRDAEETASELLRAVEQLDEVIFITDREGAITYVNPAFERVYGFEQHEVLGQTPRLLKSGELTPEAVRHFWSEIIAGRNVRAEYRNRRKDGTLVTVIASATPLFDDHGEIRGFVAIQQDVTAQKEAEEERARLDARLTQFAKMEALGTLAGGIAHDFNNILAVILAHVSLVDRLSGAEPRTARAVETIRHAVQRGASLSRQILTFARRTEMERQRTDLASIILELGQMVSETFPRTIELTIDLDPDLPAVDGDGGQIHQALLNLCVNARDAMPDGGSLHVTAHPLHPGGGPVTLEGAPPGDYVCVSVSDTGSGMDGETLSRIFDPFFTTKEKGKGTGLGLALVYGIVNAHRGIVTVDSEVGGGTVFRLYLPAAADQVERDEEPTLAGLEGMGETLLVVEDEAQLLEAITLHLRTRDYRVITASNGPDAVRLLQSASPPPDAVIIDLGMPKMGAAELIENLRKASPGIAILAMTGYVEPEIHANVLRSGVECIIQKPFQVEHLIAKLRNVLDRQNEEEDREAS